MEQSKKEAFPQIHLSSIVLDSNDIKTLADFYIQMLGWKLEYEVPGVWSSIASSSNDIRISFQCNEDYIPPVWPEEPGRQQQMLHLDFTVGGAENLEAAVAHAIACGAVKAAYQHSNEWVVLIDPAGHPFCLAG